MPRSVAQQERYRKFKRMVRSGIQPQNAGRLLSVSPQTVTRWMVDMRADEALGPEPEYDDVVREDALSPEARRAMRDFGFFRYRYLGRVSLPWQEEAGYTIANLLATPKKEYVVSNAPPGGGKSTLYTHDIPLWLIVRDRQVRCLIGSRTERQAFQYTARIRRALERTRPLKASDDDKAKGLAVDAQATLVADYGRFRPLTPELWRREEFIVATKDDEPGEDKEPTVSGWGMDSGFLGGRYNYVIWDDLIDKKTVKSVEAMQALINTYEAEMETRVEPGGCLVLNGQRMKADDLYRYALDLSAGDPLEPERRKYHHIKFQAHYEDRCRGEHDEDAEPYPKGCLLDPKRIPWSDQAALRQNKEGLYRVVYQQEDTDPQDALVQAGWIEGTDGAPGCWDRDRAIAEIPRGLDLTKCISAATVDPSPTKFWAIQWIIWDPIHDIRWLIDIERRQMGANDLLDYNVMERKFYGIMDEWQLRSVDMGAKIQAWVVEANVAQRFMLQYTWAKLWQTERQVYLIPHQTGRNKSDTKLGVEAQLPPIYQFGRMRLPGRDVSPAVSQMVSELTRYPGGTTDDTVMGHWFFEWNKDQIPLPQVDAPEMAVPSWLAAGATRGAWTA